MIKYANPLQKCISIQLIVKDLEENETTLCLPVWRPGRYEIQNFAKNVIDLRFFNQNGESIKPIYQDKSAWTFNTDEIDQITAEYFYYANQADAGGSVIDEQTLYINFINCILYVRDYENIAYDIEIQNLPPNFETATGLKNEANIFKAEDYYQLVDSPFLASSQMQKKTYWVENTPFTIWFEGLCVPDWNQIIKDFTLFTQTQFSIFKEFPFKEYHFLVRLLPYSHYHGVEHHNSTVIVFGPDYEFGEAKFYKNLLGICSHELFHAWNAIKIRPKELSPYDFGKENYFNTGFVIEGFTTFFGDWVLWKSGVYSDKEWKEEIETWLQTHFDNEGRFNNSLSQSSIQLWLDGYVKGVPNRKVSIYNEGALVAMVLDAWIQRTSEHQLDLSDFMLLMWERFGKNQIAYTYNDVIEFFKSWCGDGILDFFEKAIEGKGNLENYIPEALANSKLGILKLENEKPLEAYFGLILNTEYEITKIAKESPAQKNLSLGDKILEINKQKPEKFQYTFPDTLHLKILRNYRKLHINIDCGKRTFLHKYKLQDLII